ncbi:FAD binding domain protein [Aspergillus tetrazonus]
MARTNLLLLLYLLAVAASGSASPCRCFPGDPCWPNESEWASFNASVGGNLIATSPIASTCHTDTWFVPYNRQACADLRGNWNNPATHYETSSSPMEPWFTNFSCSPFTEPSTPCTIGPLIRYAVKVSSATDVERSLKFAKEHNIRLVIRNTGHDYLGKSTGAGSLALWTHHYKPIEHIQQYNSSWYTGPALRIGAGVQGFDALDAAHALNLTLVTGNCPTIGLAGGFTQGGGVGQLSSRFGLAADQVLEWEVVTADGKILTVSPSNNADLFWALSGGGGGTFGVVLSVVVRLHPEMATASATLQFTGAAGSIDALFWTVLETFLVDTLPLLDAGGVSVWSILPTPGSEALTFSVAPLVLPGGTVEQLNGHMASLDMLQRYNTSYSYRVKDFPTFYDSYSNTTPIVNVSEVYLGGRLIPRSTIATHPSGLIEALHSIARQGAAISGLALNTSHVPAFPNAVNPSWRETGMSIILGLPVDHINWQVNLDRQQRVTRDLVPTLAAFANADSAYLNEADFNDPYWQSAFYGINFDRLQMIKNKYDPDQLFYARTAVGSQRWEEKLDGRLCMVDPGMKERS